MRKKKNMGMKKKKANYRAVGWSLKFPKANFNLYTITAIRR